MNRQKYCPTEGNISNALIDENLQFSKEKWQNLFRKAIGIKTEKELKQKFRNYSKLKDGPFNSETFGQQEYLICVR